MKRKTLILLLTLTLSLSLFGCANSQSEQGVETSGDSLTIYTTIYPVNDFTKKLVGERAVVEALMPMGQDAHSWEPSGQDMVKLEEADLLVINGGGFEGWVDSLSASLDNEDLIIVDSVEGMELLEGHHHHHDDHDEEDHDHDEDDHGHDENHDHDDHDHDHDDHDHDDHDHDDHDHDDHDHDHDHSHDHGGMDPHVWTSPKLAKGQMENILKALIEADPENKDYYQENFDKYSKDFDQLDEKYGDVLSQVDHKDLVVSHEAFTYLAEEYGLNQIGIEGLQPESEPNPQTMATIIDLVNTRGLKAIFFEGTKSSKTADTIANETGVEVLSLSTLESLTEEEAENGEDYFSIMERNLKNLEEGLND